MTIFLVVKLTSIAKMRSKCRYSTGNVENNNNTNEMTINSNNNNVYHTIIPKELSAAITITIILLIRLGFNLPRGALLSSFAIIDNFDFMETIFQVFLHYINMFWDNIMIIDRCLNFWLYLFRISAFRKELKRILHMNTGNRQ